MTTVAIETQNYDLYEVIRTLPIEKTARVMAFISSICEDEPPLSIDEEEGIRESYASLARGEGSPFREAFKDLL